MNQSSLWRYLLMAVLIVIGFIYALPNIYGSSPAIQISAKNNAPMVEVVSKVKAALQKAHIDFTRIAKQKSGNVLIRFADTTTQFKAQDLVEATLGSNYTVAANLSPNTPAWLQNLGAQPMKLGLDLQGGIHFLLAVDVKAMMAQRERGDLRNMSNTLRKQNIRYTAVSQLPKSKGLQLHFLTVSSANAAQSALVDQFPGYKFRVIQRKGQVTLLGQMTQAEVVKIENYAIDQNLHTLRNRVNALGVAEPVIQRQGATEISVDLPGIQDTARAKNMIGKVATIRLQLQDVSHDALAASNGVVPFGSQLFHFQGRPVLLKDQVLLRGSSIVSATSTFDQNGRPAVSLTLNGEGTSLFNEETAANVGKPMATVYVETVPVKTIVNGKVQTKLEQKTRIINIATIDSALGNSFQIMGLDSVQESKNLALLLRSGAYSAPVTFISERLVGPSLGKENIHTGMLSMIVGTLLVFLFMLVYYRLFGFFADLALLLNIVFTFAIASMLGVTLTLPGIAAIVLSVGMAVDANVLINERIREELRLGMSAAASIHAGYGRAFVTIVDSNVTTLIVAVVLYALGTGPVQGFAVMLIMGLIVSMFTSIFFTRLCVNWIYGRKSVKHISIGIKVTGEAA